MLGINGTIRYFIGGLLRRMLQANIIDVSMGGGEVGPVSVRTFDFPISM
jgi:hypothetical protein